MVGEQYGERGQRASSCAGDGGETHDEFLSKITHGL
jgi:hypothetical protein